jgi:Subtilase family
VAAGGGDGWGDKDGHGTCMARLIAAHGHGKDNGDGALGIAPKAKILPIYIGGLPLARDVADARGAPVRRRQIEVESTTR